jgi:uncharacterized protein (DUF952 family)
MFKKIFISFCCFFGSLFSQEVPAYLYKVVSPENWEASVKVVKLSADDQAFIHFSTEDQLPRILSKYWSGSKYVILKVDTSKLPGKMVYEANPGGENRYYHLYNGSIPLNAVVEVKRGY